MDNLHFKEPTLLSYFPLLLFPDKYTQIASVAVKKQMYLFLNNSKVTEQEFGAMYHTPGSLLIHPSIGSWMTSLIPLPKGLPFYSNAFKVTFDILTTLQQKTVEEFRDTIRLLEIQFAPDIDIFYYLDAELKIDYGPSSIFFRRSHL